MTNNYLETNSVKDNKTVVSSLNHDELTALVNWETSLSYKIIKDLMVDGDLRQARLMLMALDLKDTDQIKTTIAESKGRLKRSEMILGLPELAKQELDKLRRKDKKDGKK